MSDHPCCRNNRGKMHNEDTKGTENKMSDHPGCRINRVPLYLNYQFSRQKQSPQGRIFLENVGFTTHTLLKSLIAAFSGKTDRVRNSATLQIITCDWRLRNGQQSRPHNLQRNLQKYCISASLPLLYVLPFIVNISNITIVGCNTILQCLPLLRNISVINNTW